MSYYNILVLVPARTPPRALHARIAKLLAPYDVHRQVEPYDCPCHCRDERARAIAKQRADREAGTWAFLDQEYRRIPESRRPPWRTFLKPWFDVYHAVYEQERTTAPPAPGCVSCGGTGFFRTTSNPQGKWDCWLISPHGFECNRNGSAVASVKKLLDEPIHCAAVVTPDGIWHEQVPVGIGTDLSNCLPYLTWQQQITQLLLAHLDCKGVLVECHI